MDFDLVDATGMLARTPATLRALLHGLPSSWTLATEGPGSWSPAAVVAHLLHADREVWPVRARTLLEHGEAVPFPAFAPEDHELTTQGIPLATLLDEFASTRAGNVRMLADRVLAADLDRTGRHPVFGTVTLSQLISAWTAHDLAHIAQIVRVMASQYRDAVGPWRARMPILEPR